MAVTFIISHNSHDLSSVIISVIIFIVLIRVLVSINLDEKKIQLNFH